MTKKNTNNQEKIEDTSVNNNSRIGMVIDCFRLNIRKKADINSEVVSIVNKSEKVNIIEDGLIKEWYHVKDGKGNEGYCMKRYINIMRTPIEPDKTTKG